MAYVGQGIPGNVYTAAGVNGSGKFVGIGTLSGLTAHGLVVSQGGGAFQATIVGLQNQVLQSQGPGVNPTYSTATYPSVATGTGTLLRADGTNWVATTSTYPNTNAVSTLLYASSANVMSALATANSAVLVTGSTGVPVWSGTMTNGQIIIGSTTATPTAATLTAGTGVNITNGAGAITVNAVGGGLTWTVITANTVGAVNNGYIANKAGTATLSLPTTSAVGDMLAVTGINTALGWQITQAAGQQIFFGTASTTSGATGTLTSSAIRDTVTLVCVVANLTWNVISSVGNPTVA